MKKGQVLCLLLSVPSSLWASSAPKFLPLTQQQQMIQVLNRLTFGPRPADYTHIQKVGIKAFIEEQLHPEKIDDSSCDQLLSQYHDLLKSSWDLYQKSPPA